MRAKASFCCWWWSFWNVVCVPSDADGIGSMAMIMKEKCYSHNIVDIFIICAHNGFFGWEVVVMVSGRKKIIDDVDNDRDDDDDETCAIGDWLMSSNTVTNYNLCFSLLYCLFPSLTIGLSLPLVPICLLLQCRCCWIDAWIHGCLNNNNILLG